MDKIKTTIVEYMIAFSFIISLFYLIATFGEIVGTFGALAVGVSVAGLFLKLKWVKVKENHR